MSSAVEPAVLVETDDQEAVTTVRLNRPDNRNALTLELKVALRDALEAVADDPSVRAVVLASSGKAFCVGQDLREHAEALRSGEDGAIGADALSTVPEHYNRIAMALGTMRKPVVCAINGTAVGAGLGFALACDLRVATAGTKFATAFAGIGFGGDSGLSGTLAHCVGSSRATELLMLGDTFTAEQARDWGIVREVAETPEATDAAALALARRLAAGPTLAFAEIKAAVAMGTVSSLREVLEHEAAAQARLGATEDHRNAVDAFVAKEKPVFRGA
ncbi:enoyl-CoA hydratase/isomerase family protein [Actinomycetospora sp. CA-084318]|uniref:enoyl-CoA hydratase/isomerase family protein n=1 Tax=Actinomycetospora sp. CA-084318 TaxID=3239892 RepID=UPI003D992635